MTNADDPLAAFTQFEEAAEFLLYEAFRYADEAALVEVADMHFGERLAGIEREPGWPPPPAAVPQSIADWIARRDTIQVLSETTIAKLRRAWLLARTEARSSNKRLARLQKFRALAMILHVTTLTTCIECVVNRHLFHLRESGAIDGTSYKALDNAELLAKILFAFKEEIQAGRLHISRLKTLISLRNKAVHFREKSRDSIAPTGEELLGIWREVGELFSQIQGEPTQAKVQTLAAEFQYRWLQ